MTPLSTRAARRRAPMAEINVTPLVDVMLVLLIIFMVTAPLLTAGVPITLPDSRAHPLTPEEKPVEVALAADGSIHVDREALSEAALPARLEAIARLPKPPQIYLRADRTLPWAKVARTMGEINRAGLTRVAVVMEPDAP